MPIPRIPACVLLTALALNLGACSTPQDTPAAKALSPETSAFDLHLLSKGLQDASQEHIEKERESFEQHTALLRSIESQSVVDVRKIDADIARMRGDMILSQYFEHLYQQKITPETVSEYYQQHRDQYTVTEHRLAHILIKTPRGASDTEKAVALTTAQEVLAKLHVGEDFAELAKTYSQDMGSVAAGGELGWASPGKLNRVLNDAVAQLEVDAEPSIVEAPYGLHIVKKLQHSRQRVLPLEQVKARIVKQLRSEIKTATLAALAENGEPTS